MREQDLYSEIINEKKQLVLKVDQTSDYVYPNELYKYQIYCKNVSGDIIEDIHIHVINPSIVAIDEDNDFEGIEIGDLKNSESTLLYLKARCSEPGEYTVHFVCYGEETGLFVKSLTINCSYDSYNNETLHRIHIYNFTPYEDTYELLSEDYNEDVTRIIKRQKLPYKAKEAPFNKFLSIDESQSYIEQARELYGDRINTDEHTYQYLERENFNESSVETFEGENLAQIFRQINKYSKFFKAKFLRTGTNYLLNDFREYNPDGFIYRFGLMSSELYHYLGVIPEYGYMNDFLFRWASEGKVPQNLYPRRLDMNWDANKWAGHGYNVWKIYTDEYKEQIINNPDYEPLYEFIETFENLTTAKQFIENKNRYEVDNQYYVNTETGTDLIKKYKYIIKESYFDNGVFFVNIPLYKIPTNFFILDTDEIEAIIEKTKPFGMKPLIRYIINTNFDINLGIKTYPKLSPYVRFNDNIISNIRYSRIPYKHNKIIEEYCYIENNERFTEEREAIRLIPDGQAYYHTPILDLNFITDFNTPDITEKEDLVLDTEIANQMYNCDIENNLTRFSQLKDLLYQGNFEEISFYIPPVKISNMKNSPKINMVINETNYQLWTESLYDEAGEKNNNPHSYWWPITFDDENNEYNYSKQNIEFLEIPLTNIEFLRHGIEAGIGFEDATGKLHGISAEKEEESDNFLIKYTTSNNKNFKIKKQGLSELKGLAFKFIPIKNNTLVVFFIKKEENGTIQYHYFEHTIVRRISELFVFVRNDKNISSIDNWGNLVKYGKKEDPEVIFNTSQYDSIKVYDPNIIKDSEGWQNINRLDRNEYSYTLNKNTTENEISVNDIELYFENIDIPDDALVKDIKLKAIVETNTYKNIYPYLRLQDGIITEDSILNESVFYPQTIECYPMKNHNNEYYQEQLNIATQNNIESNIELIENKITENILFDESLEYTLDFLDESNDYIIISKPFWVELSNFCNYDISMNEVNEVQLWIEGYNPGKEIQLTAQLEQKELLSEREEILIPSGYFKKGIPLKFYNKFNLMDLKSRFRFKDLNTDLQLFDVYLEVLFSKKQNILKEFEQFDSIEIKNKKIVDFILNKKNLNGYLLKNGLSVKLGFDNLEIGEYYRIYSIELNIIYRKQNIDFLVNSNLYIGNDNQAEFVAVGGLNSNDLMSGMFFDETIMSGTYQPKSTLNSENQGIELQDALFQSFTATADNMTGVTLYPNGFVGNPDINLKMALYTNKGNSPNRLVKEIRVSGWTKANDKLKNSTVISYDFNVNNLKIGEKYWLKIAVDSPVKNNYYLLKYLNQQERDLKLLMRVDNNLINTFGSLKFYINTLNTYRSFSSLPASETKSFINPKAFVGLNKSVGEFRRLKFLKVAIENTSNFSEEIGDENEQS